MSNKVGKAYALTMMSPIKTGNAGDIAYSSEIRNRLQHWALNENSPMAQIRQTYFCRLFVIEDVPYQSSSTGDFNRIFYDAMSIFFDRFRNAALPYVDHLESSYLVMCASFHGDPESYLRAMWDAIAPYIRNVWEYCYAFDDVYDADGFIAYCKKCQLEASLFFVGSTDACLEEHLKALYLKCEFTKFVIESQGLPAAELQQAYRQFIKRVQPRNLNAPSWKPGQSSLVSG